MPDLFEKLDAQLEARLKEMEVKADNLEKENIPPKQVKTEIEDDPLAGVVIFYVSANSGDETYIRDFQVEMRFKDEDERKAIGIALYTLGSSISDNGKSSVMLTYTGKETWRQNMITLTGIIGINTDIVPPDEWMESKEADVVIDTRKMAMGDTAPLKGVEPF